ncbi:hypothetical protein RUM43_011455 [Polyplax serrata]|uniref:C3H1-type domain-containing protein n=1 Tax=Polyplax serrata TaxID=468196 RepID=A0AAN8NT25_POLSC
MFQQQQQQQQQQQPQHQQKLLRLNNDIFQQVSSHTSAVRRVNSTGGTTTTTPRVAALSQPQTTGNFTLSTASLVNSVATLLPVLENIQNQSLHRKLDRSQSEPAKIIQVPQIINSSRYKTELCRPFEESGSCKYGDKCQFAHGAHELRSLARHPKYKTELCRTFHTIGFCPYGPRCHFVHNAEEARPTVGQMQAIQRRPTPLNIAPPFPGSVSGTPSPSSSLSQSPTTSYSSFFSEENSSIPCDSLSNPSPPPNSSPFAYRPQVQASARSNSTSPEPNAAAKDERLLILDLMALSLEDLIA